MCVGEGGGGGVWCGVCVCVFTNYSIDGPCSNCIYGSGWCINGLCGRYTGYRKGCV